MGTAAAIGARRSRPKSQRYDLVLYISGESEQSRAALANLSVIARRHLRGRFRLQVVNVRLRPNLVRKLGLVAMPILVKRLPVPLRRMVGDLGDEDSVLVGLDLVPRGAAAGSRKS